MPSLGLHHVTATVDAAQDELDCCLDALGLRFVKKTANFDNHHAYHFYYGNTPGTMWTTFPCKDRGVTVGRGDSRAAQRHARRARCGEDGRADDIDAERHGGRPDGQPGFTIDEDPASLGRDLTLPPWEEPNCADIESHLVKVND